LRTPRTRKTIRICAAIVAGLVGGSLAVAVAGGMSHQLGPLDVHLQMRLAVHGGTTVQVAPLGSLHLDSHDGPLALSARVTDVRPQAAQAIAADPGRLDAVTAQITDNLHSAIVKLAVRTVIVFLLGAVLGALLLVRSIRLSLLALAVSAGALAASSGIAAASWRPNSIATPRYTGLLADAPTAVGSVEQIIDNFGRYRDQLSQLVTNVTQLYDTGQRLPTYEPGADTIVLLHVSDLHLNPAGVDLVRNLVSSFHVDAVLDTGDVTDYGSKFEGQFVQLLDGIPVPYIVIRGNHDSLATGRQLAKLRNVRVLDNATTTVAGLRVAGIGDPRYTPDKSTRDKKNAQNAELIAAGQQLRGEMITHPPTDIAMVHDPVTAGPLAGAVPLVLAGHLHEREHFVTDGTLTLVEGSTGGAGLRGLEHEKPTPLECSVLYISRKDHRLRAIDEITVGGLGESSVQVRRTLPPTGNAPAPPASPTPSGTPPPKS
jgi:predicted phosphodiesterase